MHNDLPLDNRLLQPNHCLRRRQGNRRSETKTWIQIEIAAAQQIVVVQQPTQVVYGGSGGIPPPQQGYYQSPSSSYQQAPPPGYGYNQPYAPYNPSEPLIGKQ